MPSSKEIEQELTRIPGIGSSALARFSKAGITSIREVLQLDALSLSRKTGISIFKLVHIQATLDLSESFRLNPNVSDALVKQGILSPQDLFSRSLKDIEDFLSLGPSRPARRKDAVTLKKRIQEIKRRKLLVIVSSRNALLDLFGEKGFSKIDKSLKRLVSTLSSRKIDVICLYLDTDSVSQFGLKPSKKINPGGTKKALDSIDFKLASKEPGKRYFLLLGGHNVIPFYSLKNPAVDSDEEVLSDNPYASSHPGNEPDEWLVPERSLGRLPCGNEGDVSLLLSELEVMEISSPIRSKKEALGYSAKVWEDASEEVFSMAKRSGDIFLSPPLNTRTFMSNWLKGSGLNYFNLHGSKEDKFWFGQDGSEFPRALSPEIIAAGNVRNSLVVTEACYGGYEAGKESSNSICLQFMHGKAAGLLGSTTVSYGSEGPPLGEADLLSSKFLEQVKAGALFGDALARAKAEMASELLLSQGYLDEDDKKTLLQFVLYGNPLGSMIF
ncbi:MAG: helix-hairpin-helix domain-containing protein [Candidatus Eisenbacteria bacterium]|nr:helix-hairpin-helix domain-containing protein [Candidatus Eisenbacteria bacterium]